MVGGVVPGLDESQFEFASPSLVVTGGGGGASGDAASASSSAQVVRVGWNRGSSSSSSPSSPPAGSVGILILARPGKKNAWSEEMFDQWRRAVGVLAARDTIRAVVLCAEGADFSAGLDLSTLATTFQRYGSGGGGGGGGGGDRDCPARQRRRFELSIAAMQDAYSSLERMPWPVVAAVQGACVGAGVDLATACDLRVASRGPECYFCVKEVDVAIAADLGTLQRLPSIVGHGAAADMALTARRVGAEEALRMGLVSRVCATPAETVREAVAVAAAIASKSPLAVWGTKRTLLQTRDLPGGRGQAGLERVAIHNAAFLLSEDIREVMAARAAGRPTRFSKL